MVHSDIFWEKYLPETYAYISLSNNKYAKIILFLILSLPICLCYTWFIVLIIIELKWLRVHRWAYYDWIMWRAIHCKLSSYASLPHAHQLSKFDTLFCWGFFFFALLLLFLIGSKTNVACECILHFFNHCSDKCRDKPTSVTARQEVH